MKRVTLATIKSFIRRNIDDLYIMTQSSFDGMTDCVEYRKERSFAKAKQTESNISNTLGVAGAWFVKQSRDRFHPYSDNGFVGYEVYNCCGSFVLAVKEFPNV